MTTGRILYGLDEVLVLFQSATSKNTVVVVRAGSFLSSVRSDACVDLHLLAMGDRTIVGTVVNFVPLLESFFAVAPANRKALRTRLTTVQAHLQKLGFAVCKGYELNQAIHLGGSPKWTQGKYVLEAPPSIDARAKNIRLIWGSRTASPHVGKTIWLHLKETRTVIRRHLANGSKTPDTACR